MDVSEIAGRTAAVRFTGANGIFEGLVIRGAALELITFGFYRFWLTTDMRRYLWSGTEIDGDALEYTGRGKELLLGFLIALAILAPAFLAYFVVGIAAERLKAFASLPLYAFVFLFGQFAIFRARRYRLTRTVWRGVRFWMTGSGWSYAWRALLWTLLTVVTLGFGYPWSMAALERYKLGRTHYGMLPGRFDATGGQLFYRIWWIWLLGLLPWLLMFGGLVLAAALRAAGGRAGTSIWATAGLGFIAAPVSFIAIPFLHAARKAAEWQWWASGIRFGELSVRCTLPLGGLIGLYWALIGLSVAVMAAFAIILTAIAMTVLPSGKAGTMASAFAHLLPGGMVAMAVWYLGLFLTLGVLSRIFTLQRVWRRVASSCLVENIDAAADVGAVGELTSALGEGLADGLDFAGF